MKQTIAALAATLCCVTGAQAGVAQDQVEYWTAQYQGAELLQPYAKCEDPAIPAASYSPGDAKAVTERFERWNACYKAAVAKLAPAGEPISRVPAEVRFGMTVEQYRAAAEHMDQVYARAVQSLGGQAGPVIARYDAWAARTGDYQTRLAKAATWTATQQMAAAHWHGGAQWRAENGRAYTGYAPAH